MLKYTYAVLSSPERKVAEATSADIFTIRKDTIEMPPPGNIINGIIRRTAITILQEMVPRLSREK